MVTMYTLLYDCIVKFNRGKTAIYICFNSSGAVF
jgi:hypothetical protein